MKRVYLAIPAALALVLLVPSGSLATLTEVGQIAATTPPTVPSCPGSPCLAVSRTTGYQTQVGSIRNPVTVPREGTIVAWTITLGKPSSTQIQFFNAHEGGAATAGIAILRQQKEKKTKSNPNAAFTYKLVAQSPLVKLEKYFGETAQFALTSTLAVKKGDIVALTVPSWAPALALGFANTTSWRASRPASQCSSTSAQTAQTSLGATVQYACLYRTARLAYSTTLISTP